MEYKRLRDNLERDKARLDKAGRERSTLMQATRILGVLGFLFVLPVIGGAYLGHWLDGLGDGYSVRWTVGFILLGIVVGGVNAYLALRE
ncbi:AtpZ/AtpI family protein [Hahella sp. KA22]|uniref:AtpZ/AtpI family protein n=1 Tax=Hahella sp. KA22 TaxID=1628392 RepID=UPI000FDD43DF|nr:AtpZ/AtpI family protein [Hahella sp. KA22]AZZ90360.1 AtpZ/AtpI family protein [Hahella sp. KA22]QAY53731.1 AtpZ/AtpI family protein [Hahella sp. KA22]